MVNYKRITQISTVHQVYPIQIDMVNCFALHKAVILVNVFSPIIITLYFFHIYDSFPGSTTD